MSNKYQPIKQCSCNKCRYYARERNYKNFCIKAANRKFRQLSNLQLKNYILDPETDIDKILVSVDYYS